MRLVGYLSDLASDARCEIIVKYCGNGTKMKRKHSRRPVSFRFTRLSLFLHSIMPSIRELPCPKKAKKKKKASAKAGAGETSGELALDQTLAVTWFRFKGTNLAGRSVTNRENLPNGIISSAAQAIVLPLTPKIPTMRGILGRWWILAHFPEKRAIWIVYNFWLQSWSVVSILCPATRPPVQKFEFCDNDTLWFEGEGEGRRTGKSSFL